MNRLKNVAAALIMLLMCGVSHSYAQQPAAKSQEISDVDGRPVLIKHLPDYENVQATAVFATDKSIIKSTVGNEPVLDVVDFPVGTEAVTAQYPQGRLLIIEFTNPQASADADTKVGQFLMTKPETGTVYKRVGNYNVFVFGTADPSAGEALIDQVKYEKDIQWLGEDPFLLKRVERYLITTSKDIVISTITVIILGLGTSIVGGIAAGFIFFRIRDQKRAARTAFSDAGGLTRLNLDGLSEEL